MSTLQSSPGDRDTVQAINALKKGSYLLKYGRWGKPKFCPFRLSNDEKTLIWYVGEEQKQLQLSQVSKIIPGQRTAIFQRYPQPEKEYQSFSLIYGKNSLDVICKDKYEAETWFVALRALISRCNSQRWKADIRTEGILSDCSSDQIERNSQSILSNSSSDAVHEDRYSYNFIDVLSEKLPQKKLRKAFSDVVLHKAASLCSPLRDSVLISGILQQNEDVSGRNSADSFRHSFSSAISTSSPESSPGNGP
ncbi:UNVERIFIED_CONTAM: PH, RCC1 and FYVE domains-containing protein 1 [Sesamum radiatum]|uniref:PH, RCC1 and FYVE domains-containing protein 1 n=1 Tax=Sesamum radiatum TaxID=300843 RepID=A0AAW2PKS6_SESRA